MSGGVSREEEDPSESSEEESWKTDDEEEEEEDMTVGDWGFLVPMARIEQDGEVTNCSEAVK